MKQKIMTFGNSYLFIFLFIGLLLGNRYFNSCQAVFAAEIQTENPAEATANQKEENKAQSVLSDQLVFNFDNAELTEVIRSLAELLHINYLLEDGVGGKVSIHTAGKLSREDLFSVFYQVLEVNNLSAVKQGNLYRIVPLKKIARLPIHSYTDPVTSGQRSGKQVIIQVLPLKFISAQEMIKILTPFISPEGTIVSQETGKMIMVVDNADNIQKVNRLVHVFDTDIFKRVKYHFYPLLHVDVETVADLMEKVFDAYGASIKSDIRVIPMVRMNTLLAIGSNLQSFDMIEDLLKEYDVPSQATEPNIFVYAVKNGRAGDIVEILNKVFHGQTGSDKGIKKTETASVYRNPLDKSVKQAAAKSSEDTKPANTDMPFTEAAAAATAVSGTLRGKINITADESRNALIIEATPADYQIIKNLLIQLDILPRQVVIEMTFAEITLDASTAMGVEWSYVKGNAGLSTSLLNAKMGDGGLNVSVGSPDRWSAALSALASENKVNILSRPSVLASNSIPATIDISQEIPVASSQYEYTSGNDPMVSTDIEYRDTGILLSVTPNINEHGLVTMDIDQEISEQASNVTVGGKDYPSFFKRKTVTTLTVQSGQTIVLGGLIRETKTDGVSGTPWFNNIPILSFLFGKTSDAVSKTELIILISPYVIETPDDVDVITQEFKSKISALH